MKRFLLCSAIVLSAIAMSAQAFDVGDQKAGISIGLGIVSTDKTRATFDQHLNMEWGVANIADRFTLGVGFAVNNAYGAKFSSVAQGSFDYEYTRVISTREKNDHNRWVTSSDSQDIRRKGSGIASCDEAIEDINAMATISMHFSPTSRLDTYAKFGVGVGVKSSVLSNFHDESGFEEADYEKTYTYSNRESTTTFSYKDLDHVTWEGRSAKVAPAFAFYIGATYYITSNWGIDAQLGLVSSNIKVSDTGKASSYSLIALGASYKF
jgi:hypothetical protein